MRYLAHTKAVREELLNAIGVSSVEDLFQDIPEKSRLKEPLDLPAHRNEWDVESYFLNQAARTQQAHDGPFFIGAGSYYHHIPASVDALIQRGEFLTSYTPYQPEISQGTLQALFEFQTQVCLLTGMDLANASLYDGATAAQEAVAMANRITRRSKVVLSGKLHPHYAEVIKTYSTYLDYEVQQATPHPEQKEDLVEKIDEDTACVVVQYPDFFGSIEDYSELAKACQSKGALFIVVVTEAVSLGLLKPPGDMGADIVAGEGQSFGNAMNFGGPTVGIFAIKKQYLRQMPGRIAGQTTDIDGKRGWVLTLSTREQHIRREKATSNICTNAGLCALAFSIHLSLLGEKGLSNLARLNHHKARQLESTLADVPGLKIINTTYFNELTVKLPTNAASLVDNLARQGILAGVPLSHLYPERADLAPYLLMCATEMTSDQDLTLLKDTMTEALNATA